VRCSQSLYASEEHPPHVLIHSSMPTIHNLSGTVSDFLRITRREVGDIELGEEAIQYVKWFLLSTLEPSELREISLIVDDVAAATDRSSIGLCFVGNQPGDQGGIQFRITTNRTGYDFLLIGGRNRVPKLEASREANARIRKRESELDDLKQRLGAFLIAEDKPSSLVRIQLALAVNDAECDNLRRGTLRLIELAAHC
jgi:hypothetical protein